MALKIIFLNLLFPELHRSVKKGGIEVQELDGEYSARLFMKSVAQCTASPFLMSLILNLKILTIAHAMVCESMSVCVNVCVLSEHVGLVWS